MFLGLDIGTSSLKLTIIGINGDIKYEKSTPYPIFIDGLKSEQNPSDWIKAVKDSFIEIDASILKEVQGIGLGGQMHGMVLLDSSNEVIRPAILWNDQRTFEEVDYLNNIIGKERLLALTSNFAITGFTAPKIMWVNNNEHDNFKKIKKILLPKDYIAFYLTGVYATDYSDASGTLLLDVKNKIWSKEMLDIIGINESQLPPLAESTMCIGHVRKEIAGEFGLKGEIPVFIGGGDQAIGALGTLVTKNKQTAIALGTSGVVLVNFDNYITDKTHSLHHFCNALGGYIYMGVMLSCAQNLKWWSSIINKTIEEALDEIEKDETNLLFLPYLQGERTPINDPFACGMFYNLKSSTTKDEMTLAVIEGTTLALKDIFENIKKSDIIISSAVVNGGGTKSDLWMQILSDCLGIEVTIKDVKDAVSYGASLCALIGISGIEKLADVNSDSKRSKTFFPNKDKKDYYDKKYRLFKDLYNKTKV